MTRPTEHEIEIGKLVGALTLAGQSRDLWKTRAVEAGWNLDGRSERLALLHLIRDLTDADECQYDHHGGCQTHGYLSLKPGERCPHEEARALLAANGITEV